MCSHHHIPLKDNRFQPYDCHAQYDSDDDIEDIDRLPVQVNTCHRCDQYFAVCCKHRRLRSGYPCHQTRVIYTDGATSHNGYDDAKSGIGLVYGDGEEYEESRPVGRVMDGKNKRTNQRAALLAILHGIRLLRRTEDEAWHGGLPKHVDPNLQDWLILSNTETAVLSITDRLDRYMENDGRRSNGDKVKNWDLILQITMEVVEEEENGREVGFAWIEKRENKDADRLAKQASRSED